jgi:hypothetical protein
MEQAEFARLFESTLERAAKKAEQKLGKLLPRKFLVELYFRDYQGQIVEPAHAAEVLFIGSDKFYKIIDVCVRAVQSGSTIFFVRPSGHAPVPFLETFDPHGDGPFKQIEALAVEYRS